MKTPPQLWMLRTAFRTVGSVAPEVAARWAETIFCRPPRHDPRPAEEAFLATGARSTIRSQDEDLAVWSWGRGPTVVLAHGWGSRAGRFSALAAALVAAEFRVVLFDAPAHGASMGRQASLPQFARALRDVGDTLGTIHGLVGHSLGGAAVSLAMHQGLRSHRAVLLAPPADVFLFSHAFAEHLRIPPRARDVMQQNLEARLQISWDELHIPTLARGMTSPALVVHDAQDPDVPFAHGEEIARAWPGAELFTTQGLGHRAILRDRQVVRRTVEFLQAGLAG
ncbi:MAG TPA: alpha/beta fold hydrolase [Gemmatimonadales bacterium]|nr:alpha/beta fold hydrolase [Gemmatimonadales bacterium]